MVLSRSIRKARKDHECDYCSLKINKGECYECASIKGDNDVYTWKSHNHCEAIIDKLKMHETYYNGLGESEFKYLIQEEYRELKGTQTDFKHAFNYVMDFHLKKTNLK